MIDFSNAIWADLVGGIAMSVMMWIARAMGLIEANMEKYEGCMVTGKEEGGGTVAAGFTMHLMLSAVIAILYAWGFAAIWGYATWLTGLIGGVVHWALAGAVLPMMDGMNACVKDGLIRGFGAFGKNYGGMMVAGFLMGHLLYGIIVGWLYTVPSGV